LREALEGGDGGTREDGRQEKREHAERDVRERARDRRKGDGMREQYEKGR